MVGMESTYLELSPDDAVCASAQWFRNEPRDGAVTTDSLALGKGVPTTYNNMTKFYLHCR